jgi:hypothetical protein
MTKEVIKDNFYDKTLDKVSNEVLSFAQFLDKFAQSFKTPQEYNEKISDGIKILVQSHCTKCPKQKECFNEYRANIYIFLRYLLLRGEKEPLTFKEFSRNCVKFKELDYTTRKLSEQIDYKTPSRNNNALIGQILGVAGALRKYAVDMISKSEMDVNSWLEFKNRLQAYGFDISYFNVVKAFEQTIRILADYGIEGVVFHGFIGSEQQAKEALRRGYYLSFGVRSLRSPKTRQAIASTPLDRLFCETDDNASLDIADVYAEVAEIKGITIAELERNIYENYKRLFRINE